VLQDGDLLANHARDRRCLRDNDRKGEAAHDPRVCRGAQAQEEEDRPDQELT
jgi:hypothetical protein